MMAAGALTSLLSAAALMGPGPTRGPAPRAPAPASSAAAPFAALREALAKERDSAASKPLTAAQSAQLAEWLNGAVPACVLRWTSEYTSVGRDAQRKNVWSRGSWVPSAASVVSVSSEALALSVTVKERGKPEPLVIETELELPAACSTADELRDMLLGLSAGVDGLEEECSKLLRMPGATDRWSLPDDMWLNNVPNTRSVRQMFYDDVSDAIHAAIADNACPNRMSIKIAPPELNMEMDSYRVGTMLELVRHVALELWRRGFKTRICVQGSMGEGALAGMPRVLSGVRKLLTIMDWGAMDGGPNVGAINYDDEDEAEGPIRFGAVGADEVAGDDDVVLVIAPQSMVGASIYEYLAPMADAVGPDRPIILINPLLADRQARATIMHRPGCGMAASDGS